MCSVTIRIDLLLHMFIIMSGSKSTTTPKTDDSEILYDNFFQMSLGELQDYLSVRKLSIFCRKRELVARAFAACEQGAPIAISDNEFKLKKNQLKIEYNERISALDIDPMVVSPDLWKDDIKTWPPLDLGKIFAYHSIFFFSNILSNKEFESDYVGKYKLCKWYFYFASGLLGGHYFLLRQCRIYYFKVQSNAKPKSS